MMISRRVLAVLCGTIAMVTCCTACTSPADQLRPVATKAVRAKATGALGQLRATTPPTSESIDRTITEVAHDWNNGGSTVLLGKDLSPNGRFTARYAFFALVGDGFSGQYDQLAVRLCVSYSGDPKRPSAVEMADLTCPSGLPDPSDSVPVDRDVKLAD